jgi:hypothetical protein
MRSPSLFAHSHSNILTIPWYFSMYQRFSLLYLGIATARTSVPCAFPQTRAGHRRPCNLRSRRRGQTERQLAQFRVANSQAVVLYEHKLSQRATPVAGASATYEPRVVSTW